MIAATASLVISGPRGPCQAHSIPVRTPAASIAATVASAGTSPLASWPRAQRRRESNIGSARNAADGCCIQASMITMSALRFTHGTQAAALTWREVRCHGKSSKVRPDLFRTRRPEQDDGYRRVQQRESHRQGGGIPPGFPREGGQLPAGGHCRSHPRASERSRGPASTGVLFILAGEDASREGV